MAEVPELLFHTVLTVIDYHADTSGSTQTVYVLGTHTTLEAAKAFSYTALEGLGYQPDDFAEFETRATKGPETNWTHGDGVMVYTKAPAGRKYFPTSSFCFLRDQKKERRREETHIRSQYKPN